MPANIPRRVSTLWVLLSFFAGVAFVFSGFPVNAIQKLKIQPPEASKSIASTSKSTPSQNKTDTSQTNTSATKEGDAAKPEAHEAKNEERPNSQKNKTRTDQMINPIVDNGNHASKKLAASHEVAQTTRKTTDRAPTNTIRMQNKEMFREQMKAMEYLD